MADIFISYAREDREHAKDLAEALADRGWVVWWDREMRAGSSFGDVIENELATAKAVIVLWSAHSVKSSWVQNEAREGAARNVLVPVQLDPSRPPIEFRHLHTANIDELEDIMSSVAALISSTGGTRAVPTPPVEAAPRSRFKQSSYIGIAVIVLLLIVIAILPKSNRPPQVVSNPDTTPTTSALPTTTGTTTTTEPPTNTGTTGTGTETSPPGTVADPPRPPTLPVSAVGILMANEQVRCTAFLISTDIAVTSAACAKNAQPPLLLRLGQTRTGARPVDHSVFVQQQSEKYALLKAAGSPGRTFSSIRTRSRPAVPGETAILLHYEQGAPLSITRCPVVAVAADELQYRCTTGRRSLGGPLLGMNDGALLGFHSGSAASRDDALLKRGVPAAVFTRSLRPVLGPVVRPVG